MSRERFITAITGRDSLVNLTGPYALMRRFAVSRGVRLSQIIAQDRRQPLATHRQDCMAFIRRQTCLSFPEIGRLFGDRDHTTIMHAIKASEARQLSIIPEITRKICVAMAKRGECTYVDLARDCGTDVNSVKSEVRRLSRIGLLKTVSLDDTQVVTIREARKPITNELDYAAALRKSIAAKPKVQRSPPILTRAEIKQACAERRDAILNVLAGGPTSNISIVNATGCPASTIKDDLWHLSKRGLVHSIGKSRGTRWHLGPEQVAA